MANVIITGTSRGIGFELAKLFADEGHQVLALSRNNAPITELQHRNITSFPFDLSNSLNFEKLEAYLEDWETVDILINNAGKLLNKIRKKKLERGNMKIGITVSIGVAQMLSNDDIDSLMDRAETGVHSARDNGRDTFATGYDWILIDYFEY